MIYKIINNCHICSSSKYERRPVKPKFAFTETPTKLYEIIHVDTSSNSKYSFVIFIDKLSKHAIWFHLPDRNSLTIIQKIQEFIDIKGKVRTFVFDNEFRSKNVIYFLNEEKIEFHITMPNSHTGNSDIERINNTITERIKSLNLEEKISFTE